MERLTLKKRLARAEHQRATHCPASDVIVRRIARDQADVDIIQRAMELRNEHLEGVTYSEVSQTIDLLLDIIHRRVSA